MTSDREVVRLYNLLSFPGYTMLIFIDPDRARQERDKIDRSIGYGDSRLNVQIVLNNGLPELHNFQANTLVDYRGDLETKLGDRTERIILIRPDGYVACDLSTLDRDLFIQHLGNWKRQNVALSPELAIQ